MIEVVGAVLEFMMEDVRPEGGVKVDSLYIMFVLLVRGSRCDCEIG